MVRKNRVEIFLRLHSFSTMRPVDVLDPALDTLRLVLSNPSKLGKQQLHPHLLWARRLQTFTLSKMLGGRGVRQGKCALYERTQLNVKYNMRRASDTSDEVCVRKH